MREPMLAREVGALPAGDQWVFEPKWAGTRALAVVDGAARIRSAAGDPLEDAFPEVAAGLVEQLPGGTEVDGEIVRWSAESRLRPEAVRRRLDADAATALRLAREEPCHYVVFDLLRLGGEDLAEHELRWRRARLERLFRDVPASAPLVLGWQTPDVDEALDWFGGMVDIGVEGLVMKDAAQSYRPGHREWLTYQRPTTEA